MSQEVSSEVVGAPEVLNPPREAPPSNHGRTIAGWALAWICAIGSTISAVGAIIDNWTVIIAGAIVVVVGLLAGGALRALGHGQPKTPRADQG